MVSFVIPVYNKQELVKECIESILTISKVDFEIILVDDGSRDNSLQICERYSRENNNIKTISQVNQGVSVARNTGILHAKGEYIAFVDADDFIKKELEEALITAEKEKKDFYIFNYTRWESCDKQSVGRLAAYERDTDSKAWLTNQVAGLELCVLGVWAGLYKKSIIEKHRLQFKCGMRTCEDFYFNLQYIQHVESMNVINNAGYCYRDNPESVTNKRPLTHADDYEFIFAESKRYLNNNNATRTDYDIFYRRWLRWCIDLIFNWRNQKISSAEITKKIESLSFWNQIVKELNGKVGFHIKLEKYFLKNHYIKMIFIYRNLLELLKKTRGKV